MKGNKVMKTIYTRIKFTELEWKMILSLFSKYTWGYEVTKIKIKWANKAAREIMATACDSDNNKLYELMFIL